MNGKFFALPEEKRQRIINAGFRVFSSGAYKKCPVAEIAAEAGISKSLLFHYFADKLELYMFLWDEAARLTMEYLNRYGCYEPGDLFEMMERGMRAKLEIMRNYPAMAAFSIRAFYEKEPNLQAEIQESYKKYFGMKAEKALAGLDPESLYRGWTLGECTGRCIWPQWAISGRACNGVRMWSRSGWRRILSRCLISGKAFI